METDEGGISIDFHRIFEALKKYFWVVLLFLIAGIVGAVAYLNIATPIYESYSVLKVEQRVRDAAPFTSNSSEGLEDLRSLEMVATLQRGFLSRTLMGEVSDHLKLAERKGFLPKSVPADEKQNAIIKYLLKNTDAQVIRGTRLIQLSFEHPDPDIATEVTGALITEYKALDADQRLQAASGSLAYLQREKERLEKQLTDSGEKLASYTRNLGSVSVDDELNIIADQLKELNTRLTIAISDRLKLEADYEQIQNVRNDPQALLQIESVSKLPEIQSARTSLNQIDGEIAKMQERYGRDNPQLVQLLSQREGLQKALYAEALRGPRAVEISLRAAVQNEKSLERETKKQEIKTIDVKDLAMKTSVMRRQIEADQLAYKSVCERLNDEESQARSQQIFLQVMDAPSPAAQVKPRPLLVVALALVASMGLAVGTIFLLAIADTSLKSVDETERALGVHVLAAIPQLSASRDEKGKTPSTLARIPLLEDPHSTISESFRTMRASLLLLEEDEQPFVLMTSAVPGEGKSFCSINLAVAMAQQGMKTLLVDADLRKPVIEGRLFGTSDERGLSDFLMGKVDFEDVLRPTKVPNLYAITAGRRYANPAELLLRQERVKELLDNVQKQFDRGIVDSAPVLAVSDTLNLARHFKTIGLVLRSHKTPRRLAVRAEDLLARTGHPVSGVVLNMVPARGAAYYYYSYGKEGQTYGAPADGVKAPAHAEV
ncbi:MAG TPA: polysaccharide biosynthesis tyrosine autokinase [Chthoniobacterales bacterium]